MTKDELLAEQEARNLWLMDELRRAEAERNQFRQALFDIAEEDCGVCNTAQIARKALEE